MKSRSKSNGNGSSQHRKKSKHLHRKNFFDNRLAEILRDGEGAGLLRFILRGASQAFRKMEVETPDWNSSAARILRERRDIIVRHLVSLVLELDTNTKVQIIRDLIGDLSCRASKDSCERALETGVLIKPDEQAGRAFFLMLRDIVPACCQLLREGHDEFGSEMVLYAAQLVETLNDVARRQPNLFHDIASERVDWPILASYHYPKKSDFQELAKRIHLASTSPVQPRRNHTWKPHTEVNRYLLEMLVVERWGDGRPLTQQNVPYYLNEVLMPLFDRVADEEGGWENYPEFAAIAKKAAQRGKKGVQRSEIRGRVARALRAMAS